MVKKDGFGSFRKRDSVILISRTTTKIWTPTLVKTITSVGKELFCSYGTYGVRCVKDYYVGQVLDNGYVGLLGCPTNVFEGHEKEA